MDQRWFGKNQVRPGENGKKVAPEGMIPSRPKGGEDAAGEGLAYHA